MRQTNTPKSILYIYVVIKNVILFNIIEKLLLVQDNVLRRIIRRTARNTTIMIWMIWLDFIESNFDNVILSADCRDSGA